VNTLHLSWYSHNPLLRFPAFPAPRMRGTAAMRPLYALAVRAERGGGWLSRSQYSWRWSLPYARLSSGSESEPAQPWQSSVLRDQAGCRNRACAVHPIPIQYGTLLGTNHSAASSRSAEEGTLPAHRHVICGEGASFDQSRPYPTRERKLGWNMWSCASLGVRHGTLLAGRQLATTQKYVVW
jgi:hypothetical protein